jgi:hypothetical protein
MPGIECAATWVGTRVLLAGCELDRAQAPRWRLAAGHAAPHLHHVMVLEPTGAMGTCACQCAGPRARPYQMPRAGHRGSAVLNCAAPTRRGPAGGGAERDIRPLVWAPVSPCGLCAHLGPGRWSPWRQGTATGSSGAGPCPFWLKFEYDLSNSGQYLESIKQSRVNSTQWGDLCPSLSRLHHFRHWHPTE